MTEIAFSLSFFVDYVCIYTDPPKAKMSKWSVLDGSVGSNLRTLTRLPLTRLRLACCLSHLCSAVAHIFLVGTIFRSHLPSSCHFSTILVSTLFGSLDFSLFRFSLFFRLCLFFYENISVYMIRATVCMYKCTCLRVCASFVGVRREIQFIELHGKET